MSIATAMNIEATNAGTLTFSVFVDGVLAGVIEFWSDWNAWAGLPEGHNTRANVTFDEAAAYVAERFARAAA